MTSQNLCIRLWLICLPSSPGPPAWVWAAASHACGPQATTAPAWPAETPARVCRPPCSPAALLLHELTFNFLQASNRLSS